MLSRGTLRFSQGILALICVFVCIMGEEVNCSEGNVVSVLILAFCLGLIIHRAVMKKTNTFKT